MTGSRLLGLGRAIPYFLLTFAIMPIQALALMFGGSAAERIPVRYHRICARLLGFRVVVRGTPSSVRPTLFVANHTSYFDIILLASVIPCSFIAKSEMISWPLIGWLARLQRSVFVDRKPTNVGEHRTEVAKRLAEGDNLVLFAEGTTSDGNRLLPFKSSLFSVAEKNLQSDMPLTIQPVSIVATGLDGMPLGRMLRPLYAWYGDMPLLPHAWAAIKSGLVTVEIEFHEPLTNQGMNRKQLAEICRSKVEAGFVRSITGRSDAGTGTPDIQYEEKADAVEAAA
jgi:1-acyl-sn-glycerol-3-phosphate acyltransferase